MEWSFVQIYLDSLNLIITEEIHLCNLVSFVSSSLIFKSVPSSLFTFEIIVYFCRVYIHIFSSQYVFEKGE